MPISKTLALLRRFWLDVKKEVSCDDRGRVTIKTLTWYQRFPGLELKIKRETLALS